MAEEIVKIINIKTDQAITTVKELKQYISELKDDLVKTDRTSEEYKKTLDELAIAQTKLTEVTNDAKQANNYAEGSYRALNQELVRLRNEYKNLTEAERNNASVGGAILTRIQELDNELKSIDATMGNYQRNVGHYQLALEALNKTYANQRQELKALKIAMESLDEGSAEYQQAFNRSAEITHNLAEQQELLKYSSADLGDQLSNMRGIATNMIAGFSAVNAAMGMFGEKNEDVQKAMLKVQQAMAIVQGLQGMDGLIKRTRGLSTAMKVWFNTSKDVTKATVAQATAVQSETVATQGATVAQKGLNAAMKANPIGFVLTAVMALVTAFTLFKGKLDKLIQGNEKLQTILGKVRGALSAFGSTLKNVVLVPVQELINYVKTLGAVMIDVFNGNWDKIGEDFKAGIENAKNIVVNAGKDIAKSYNEGVQAVNEEYARKRAEARAKELEEINDANDAKYGSDWKYTESGKTLYDEYLQAKIDSYKKDSDEYKKAVNAKVEYEREYREKKEKADKEAEKKRLEAAKEAQKAREQLEKNYISSIQKKYGTSVRETINTYKEELKTLGDFLTGQLSTVKQKDKKNIKKVIDEINKEIKKTDSIDIFNYESPEGTFDNLQRFFTAKIKDVIANSNKDIRKSINNEITKLFEKTIVPDLSKETQRLQNEINQAGINFENAFEGADDASAKQLELAYNTDVVTKTMEQLNIELDHYQQIVDFVNENGLELLPNDEYDKAKQHIIEIQQLIQKTQQDGAKADAEIIKKYFEKDIETIETVIAAKVRDINNALTKTTEGESWWNNLVPDNPKDVLNSINEIFDTEINGLEKIKEMWGERANDESLSYEERLEAKKQYQITSDELEDKILEKQITNAKKRDEITDMWVQGVSDAVQQIGNLFGSLADYYEADVEAKVKAGEMTEKEADEQFENIKGMRIAEATINTIAGAIGAFLQASATYPAPYGQIIGGITAAAVAAAGAAQIAKIKSSTRSGGSAANAAVSVPQSDFDFAPSYVANTTGQEDTQNLRNALTEQPIKAYIVESEVTDAQELARKRSTESSF